MSPVAVPQVKKLVAHGAAMNRFNIVVLGDGFQKPELPTFDEYANLIAVRLLNMAPFKGVADRINVWKVSTVSADSGVTLPGAARNTFYGVEGDFLGKGVEGYFGTQHMDRVRDTAALAVPEEAHGVRIMVVNYDADGGRGSQADRTVFVPLFRLESKGGPALTAAQRKKSFVDTTGHECGHAIANLAEEYISCNPHTVGERHANQQTPEETTVNPVVKWKPLSKTRERKANGDFKAVHEFGDPMTVVAKDEPIDPVVKKAFEGMLGLYWGCMDIDPTLPITSPSSSGLDCDRLDPRGAPFHRPMACCRMRYEEDRFCRVCANEIKRIILDVTP